MIPEFSAFSFAAPEELGVSSESIMDFFNYVKAHSVEMHRFVLMRKDKVLSAAVFSPYKADVPHILFSFSKSLTSTAAGFLWQDGLLSLNEKIIDIFPEFAPENPSENLKKCDIRSLLTMTCGHASEISWGEDSDASWIRKFMENEFVYAPGEAYMYNTAGTNVVAAIIQKKTGMKLTEYLKLKLTEPLGMADIYCRALSDGTEAGGAGMYLALEDMMKFSSFLLHRGAYKGKQLLKSGWFDMAATFQTKTLSPVYDTDSKDWMKGYGFQFWMCQPEGVFRADGAYGQFAIIDPKREMAAIINSASFNAQAVLQGLWDTIWKNAKDGPLPENKKAGSALKAFMENAEIPPLFNPRMPDLENFIKGKTFLPKENLPSFPDIIGGSGRHQGNDSPLQALSFEFTEEGLNLIVTSKKGTSSLPVSYAAPGPILNMQAFPMPQAAPIPALIPSGS